MTISFSIAGRFIGPEHPPYFIAELSGNHNGSLDRALALMELSARAGADAVKLQTYTADTMTIDHDGPGFRVEGGSWDGQTLYDLYHQAHTPWEWHPALFAKGRELGVTVFSSPFDATAVAFLQTLDAPVYKIASFELVDLPLIRLCAATGKPMVLSTGMASVDEIHEALHAARSAGCRDLALLHCISAYPAPPEAANLATIRDLAERFGVVTGLSDHTLGTTVSVAAVALGANIIEKHVCLSRAEGGVDSGFSLEPAELEELISSIKTAYQAIGRPSYGAKAAAEVSSTLYRRSLYVVAAVAKGERLTSASIRAIRPGFGLPPKYLEEVLGKRAVRDLQRGEPLSFTMFEP